MPVLRPSVLVYRREKARTLGLMLRKLRGYEYNVWLLVVYFLGFRWGDPIMDRDGSERRSCGCPPGGRGSRSLDGSARCAMESRKSCSTSCGGRCIPGLATGSCGRGMAALF